MKWLALNEITYERITRKVAINPSMIIMVAPCRKGTEIYFMDEGMITVEESFDEVMRLLGGECLRNGECLWDGECLWKMP